MGYEKAKTDMARIHGGLLLGIVIVAGGVYIAIMAAVVTVGVLR